MGYEFVLTFIFTFLVVSIISFIVNRYLSKGKADKKKGYTMFSFKVL